MAPPASRRTGTNKKAQLGLFAGYVAAGLGVLLGGALLVISLLRPATFDGLRAMAADVAAPAGQVGAAGRTGGQGFFAAIAGYYRAGSRNAELEEEMKIARVRLAEAEAAGNYRLALRLGYLQLLKLLSDQNLIRWQPDKTNHAYLAELPGEHLRAPFRELTRQFEYVWYGELPLPAGLYQQARAGQQGFRQALGQHVLS